MQSTDPREIINDSAMTRMQILIIGITIGLNALDGFDVMSISFAAPGIADEWGITRGALGIVLSMELLGMGIGSILLGSAADRYGRRSTVLGCLLTMALGMFMVTTTDSIVELSLWRILTGLGIGGMLAATNALAAEFANKQRRHMSVSLMAIGYPIGGVLGGSIASWLLNFYDWRIVFYFGTAVTVLFIPLVWFMLPESVFWITRKQPANALDKVNHSLKRLGHATVSTLPTISEFQRKANFSVIFRQPLRATTIIVASAYFMHILTFYFILKWVPELVVDMGFTSARAGGVLVWASIGGAIGGGIFGFLTNRFDLRKLTILCMILGAIFNTLFGQTPADLVIMSALVASTAFFTNAGVVGMYALLAQVYPTQARAFGTGFSVGFGRGGSVLSPIIAGFLLQFNISLPVVAFLMGLGSIVAAIALLFLKVRTGDDDEKTAENGA